MPHHKDAGINRHVCYLVGAGPLYAHSMRPRDGDLVIAVDGGFDALRRLSITPHLLIGDFDSLKAPVGSPGSIRLPKEKDDTDMAFAIRKGREMGYRVFHLYGGMGGRLDHTLANLQCLAGLSRDGCEGYLIGRREVATAVTNATIHLGAGFRGTVSVFAHSSAVTGVRLRGLKYPLEDATLQHTVPLGVSNEFTGVPSQITAGDGTLIVLLPLSARRRFPASQIVIENN